MQMKLSQLRVFLEIVRTGGVRSAAAALHLSQSAVTKSLAQLESECGVALFIRTGRGLLPTEEGERLLPCAQAVLANVERAESVIADASRLRRSRLRVAIAPTVPTEVVRSAVRTFRTRFPETELTFSSGLFADAAPLILTDKLDLALVILSDLTRREVGRLDIESLFTVGYGLVARRGAPDSLRRRSADPCPVRMAHHEPARGRPGRGRGGRRKARHSDARPHHLLRHARLRLAHRGGGRREHLAALDPRGAPARGASCGAAPRAARACSSHGSVREPKGRGASRDGALHEARPAHRDRRMARGASARSDQVCLSGLSSRQVFCKENFRTNKSFCNSTDFVIFT